MKLAEARNRILEIDHKISTLRERLRKGTLNAVKAVLDELNQISEERQRLQVNVSQIEAKTVIAGSTLRDLNFVIEENLKLLALFLFLRLRLLI